MKQKTSRLIDTEFHSRVSCFGGGLRSREGKFWRTSSRYAAGMHREVLGAGKTRRIGDREILPSSTDSPFTLSLPVVPATRAQELEQTDLNLSIPHSPWGLATIVKGIVLRFSARASYCVSIKYLFQRHRMYSATLCITDHLCKRNDFRISR